MKLVRLVRPVRLVRAGTLALGLAVAGPAAAVTFFEVESGDDAASANVFALPGGDSGLTIEGRLGIRQPFVFAGLFDGFVFPQTQVFAGAGLDPADQLFVRASNNPLLFGTPVNVPPLPNLAGGVFGPGGVLLASDANPAPGGDGTASILGFAGVHPDGTFDVRVTGAPNVAFDGTPHTETGAFDLQVGVNQDPSTIDPLSGSDVDFIRLTGLTPGNLFTAGLTGDFFSLVPPFPGGGALGFIHPGGQSTVDVDVAGEGILVGGVVPAGGEVLLAVSGQLDVIFSGLHTDFGDWGLDFQQFALGDPGAPVLDDFVVLPSNLDELLEDGSVPFLFDDLVVEAGELVNLDPFFATGYEYTVGGGGLFGTVSVPTLGDGFYVLEYFDGTDFILLDASFEAGETFDFVSALGFGVDRFRITDIELSAETDPTDDTAFVTTVSFVSGGTFDVTQQPLTVFVPASTVPEPGALALLGLGLAGLGWGRRRRRLAA